MLINMKTSLESKQAIVFLGVLVILAFVSIMPNVSAQMYNNTDNPTGPLEAMAWGVMVVAAAIMSGVGIYTTTLKH